MRNVNRLKIIKLILQISFSIGSQTVLAQSPKHEVKTSSQISEEPASTKGKDPIEMTQAMGRGLCSGQLTHLIHKLHQAYIARGSADLLEVSKYEFVSQLLDNSSKQKIHPKTLGPIKQAAFWKGLPTPMLFLKGSNGERIKVILSGPNSYIIQNDLVKSKNPEICRLNYYSNKDQAANGILKVVNEGVTTTYTHPDVGTSVAGTTRSKTLANEPQKTCRCILKSAMSLSQKSEVAQVVCPRASDSCKCEIRSKMLSIAKNIIVATCGKASANTPVAGVYDVNTDTLTTEEK